MDFHSYTWSLSEAWVSFLKHWWQLYLESSPGADKVYLIFNVPILWLWVNHIYYFTRSTYESWLLQTFIPFPSSWSMGTNLCALGCLLVTSQSLGSISLSLQCVNCDIWIRAAVAKTQSLHHRLEAHWSFCHNQKHLAIVSTWLPHTPPFLFADRINLQ